MHALRASAATLTALVLITLGCRDGDPSRRSSTATLSGTVIGSPSTVGGASISVREYHEDGDQTGRLLGSAISSMDGRWSIAGLPTGRTLVVRVDGRNARSLPFGTRQTSAIDDRERIVTDTIVALDPMPPASTSRTAAVRRSSPAVLIEDAGSSHLVLALPVRSATSAPPASSAVLLFSDDDEQFIQSLEDEIGREVSEGIRNRSPRAKRSFSSGETIDNVDPGATLLFTRSTLAYFEDETRTEISFSELPVGDLSVPFPVGLTTAKLVSLQPLRMSFSRPARVSYSNWNELPPGTTGVGLYRLQGRAWIRFGTGTVDARGEWVVSDDDSGLHFSGLSAPFVPQACTTTITGRVVAADQPGRGLAEIRVFTSPALSVETDADGSYSIEGVTAASATEQVTVFALPLDAGSPYGEMTSSPVSILCSDTTRLADIELPTQVVDATALSVESISPRDGASEVDRSVSVRITFSERPTPGSVHSGTVSLHAVTLDAVKVPLDGTLALDGTVATFTPLTPLPGDRQFFVEVSAEVFDFAGNALEEPFSSTFSTGLDAPTGAPSLSIDGPAELWWSTLRDLNAELRDASGSLVEGAPIAWLSETPDVVSVGQDGTLRVNGVGTATVRATSGLATSTWTRVVGIHSEDAIGLVDGERRVIVGSTMRIGAELTGTLPDRLPPRFSWSSANESIATVDASGDVLGVAPGITTITGSGHGLAIATAIEVVTGSVESLRIEPRRSGLEVGSTRQLTTTALDAAGDLLPGIPVTWTSSAPQVAAVDARLGIVTARAEGTVTITASTESAADEVVASAILTVSSSSSLAIRLLGGGRPEDPISGRTILLNDPGDGALLGQQTTDSEGIADFGAVELTDDRATLTLVETFGRDRVRLTTYHGVPLGSHEISGSPEGPTARLDVTLQGIDSAAGTAAVRTGGLEGGRESGGSPSEGLLMLPGHAVSQLQDDGRVSLLSVARSSPERALLAYGAALDLDPATASVTIPTSDTPQSLAFTANTAVLFDGFTLERRGIRFAVPGPRSAVSPRTSGVIRVCPLPDAESYSISFMSPEHDSTISRVTHTYAELPASMNLNLPSLDLDLASFDGRAATLYWAASGDDLDQVDGLIAVIGWRDALDRDVEWQVCAPHRAASVSDPASLTLPELPTELSEFYPPAGGLDCEFELIGLDDVVGFDAFWSSLQAGDGSRLGTRLRARRSIAVRRSVFVR